ncbi:MAG: SGNH/GDSL hydrolase family protein [Planctomycetales bacterium]|nr:SGNH/GDSL hydrolase family protein [Planctomycetales bacterium]
MSIRSNRGSRSWRRAVGFRIGAIILGLLPLVMLEFVLRAGGWGRPGDVDDPYVGFASTSPLFQLTADGQSYEIAPGRLEYFRPESFSARKGPREFRIFCLGGSTVQGRPYSTETSFTAWLELNLKAADDRREWNVINCGGVSYASYRLTPILRETLAYQPDLYILYTGHNEFLEERTYGEIRRHAMYSDGRLAAMVRRTHLYGLSRSAWEQWWEDDHPAEPRPILPGEVDALLDYRGGLEAYHHDEVWREAVVEHYKFNLCQMVGLVRDAGVPLLFVDPISNQKDSPPFKVEHAPKLSAASKAEFDQRWNEVFPQETNRSDPPAPKDLGQVTSAERIDLLGEASRIDPFHAAAHFALARALESAGRRHEAAAEYVAARETDVCPLRMIEPLHRALRSVATQTGTPLLDANNIIAGDTPVGLIGDEWLVDHVHPSVASHQRLAAGIFDQLVSMGVIETNAEVEQRRAILYARHLESLDPAYFERGKQRLAGLRMWAEGRANKVRNGPVEHHP